MAPFVREYNPDIQPAGPFETRQARDMDTGETGRALARLGDTISNVGSEIQQRDAQNEITDISAKLATAHAQFTDQLTDSLQNGDPNDRDFANKFMQNYDNQIASIGDSATTPQARRYFERMNAQMRAHFTMRATQGQANLQGQNAVDGLNTENASYQDSLIKDPDSFETVRNLNAASIQEKVDAGLLPKNKALEYQADSESALAQSALRGWITKGASQRALSELNSGKWDDYLDGDSKFKMIKEAEQGINGERIQADRYKEQVKQAKRDAADTEMTSLLAGFYTKDNPTTAQDILASKNTDFQQKATLLRMLKQNSEEKLHTDAQTYLGLANRIFRPDGDPEKIVDDAPLNQAFADGKLTHTDLMALRQEVFGSRTPEGKARAQLEQNFLKSVKDKLTKSDPLLGVKDPEGDEHYAQFYSDYLGKRNAALKSGKSIQDLTTPSSPDYLAKDLSAYQRTPEDILKSQLGSQNAPGSAATQSVPSPAPSTQQGAGRSGGKMPPPGLTFEQFKEWRKKNGG